MKEEKTARRDFLVKLGIGAGGVGIGTQAAASLRSLSWRSAITTPPTTKEGSSEAIRIARDSGSA